MRRRVAQFAIVLPVILLLLHTITPHRHVNTLAPTESGYSLQENRSCPYGFLSGIFKYDLGAHHLEEYQVERQVIDACPDIVPLIADLPFLLEPVFTEAYVELPVEGEVPVSFLFPKGPFGLRAPPAQMI